MERSAFHKLFKTGAAPAVLPVVHVKDFEQTKLNVTVALRQGAQGVFLINHGLSPGQLIPIIKQVRSIFPYVWLGVNFLGVTGRLMRFDIYDINDERIFGGRLNLSYTFKEYYIIIVLSL